MDLMVTKNNQHTVRVLEEEDKTTIHEKWKKKKQISTLPQSLHDITVAQQHLKDVGRFVFTV